MQRATVLAGDRREIIPEDLSFSSRVAREAAEGTTLGDKIEALERREIQEALEKHNNNRTHAAQALGLSRQGLLKKLERYGLG
jgi:transcriptional regulator with PAS, ATPase and Fis domain